MECTNASTCSMVLSSAEISSQGASPNTCSLVSIQNWYPNFSGLFSICGRYVSRKDWSSCRCPGVSTNARQCTSSLVVISAPQITSKPSPAPSSCITGACKVLLWSVMAIICTPFPRAASTIWRGVISISPQGDKKVWICRSAFTEIMISSGAARTVAPMFQMLLPRFRVSEFLPV